MHRLLSWGVVASFLAAGCTEEGEGAGATWPRRPIQITCFAAAGGGTDTVDRMIAQALEPHLGVRINVVNMTGAHGGTALHDVWSRPHDGYRWGGFSESVLTASVMKGHDTTAKDWTYFMVSGAPGVLSVKPDSKYDSLDALLAAARAAPRTINAAASITGGIWHTKLLALERAAGVEFNRLPYKGSNPSQLAVLSGEAVVVVTSISEQAELIKAGKLRPLAMVETEAYEFPGTGRIPAAGEKYPDIARFPVTQWLGFALPADASPEVLARVTEAFAKAMDSEEIRELNKSRFLTPYGYSGEKADALARKMERAWVWQLHDLKIAARSPEEVGIARP